MRGGLENHPPAGIVRTAAKFSALGFKALQPGEGRGGIGVGGNIVPDFNVVCGMPAGKSASFRRGILMHDDLRRRDMHIAVFVTLGCFKMPGLGFCPAIIGPFPMEFVLARVGGEADLERVVLIEMEVKLHLRGNLPQVDFDLLLKMRIPAQQRRQELACGGGIDLADTALKRQRHE